MTTLSVTIQEFVGDSLPRSYIEAGTLTFSAAGSAVQSGSSRKSRRVWAIAAIVPTEVAMDLDDLYQAWDQRRADGYPSVVALTDSTLVRDQAQPIQATATFTNPVQITPVNATSCRVSCALTEV